MGCLRITKSINGYRIIPFVPLLVEFLSLPLETKTHNSKQLQITGAASDTARLEILLW